MSLRVRGESANNPEPNESLNLNAEQQKTLDVLNELVVEFDAINGDTTKMVEFMKHLAAQDTATQYAIFGVCIAAYSFLDKLTKRKNNDSN